MGHDALKVPGILFQQKRMGSSTNLIGARPLEILAFKIELSPSHPIQKPGAHHRGAVYKGGDFAVAFHQGCSGVFSHNGWF
jgi:hypothetical protein